MSARPQPAGSSQDFILPIPSYPSDPRPSYKPRRERSIEGESVMLDKNTLVYSKSMKPTRKIESVEAKFKRFTQEWRRDVFGVSSSSDIYSHPAYHRIISLGEKAIPLILHEMQQGHEHWDYALWIITEENPVKPRDAGKMDKMVEAWLNWGKERGYI